MSFVNVYKTLASWLRELRVVSLKHLSRYKLYRSIDLHLLQAGYIPAHKALCVLYCIPGPKFSMWTNIFGKTGPGGGGGGGGEGTKMFIDNFGPRTVFAGTKITVTGLNVDVILRF